MKVFLILAIFLPALCLGQGSLMCYEPGECQGGIYLNFELDSSYNECLKSCNDYPTCEFFTFNDEGNACTFFLDCPEISTALCANCYSGQRGWNITMSLNDFL